MKLRNMKLVKKYGRLTGKQKFNVFIVSFFSCMFYMLYMCFIGSIVQQSTTDNYFLIHTPITLGGGLIVATIVTFLWIKHEKIKGETKNESGRNKKCLKQ